MVIKRILLLLGCMACVQQSKFHEKCENIRHIPVAHEAFDIIDTISIYKLVKNYELWNKKSWIRR
ncbi:hypothetical protein OK18_08280 [Chryseobacterium gallinarum]|uniref:Uncharacterized protein n=1 Tax=Chryseobacterium gallinarum TaxID=1324352 RepID=A0A0G3M0E1_CHRGL|nr:hypothetical protein OK18_08280 [Chryseobacterium gallinarum]